MGLFSAFFAWREKRQKARRAFTRDYREDNPEATGREARHAWRAAGKPMDRPSLADTVAMNRPLPHRDSPFRGGLFRRK